MAYSYYSSPYPALREMKGRAEEDFPFEASMVRDLISSPEINFVVHDASTFSSWLFYILLTLHIYPQAAAQITKLMPILTICLPPRVC